MSALTSVKARITGPCADNTRARTARKDHRCSGRRYLNGGAVPGSNCKRVIEAGSVYIECFDSTALYQSGDRYHVECAVEEGLVAPEASS